MAHRNPLGMSLADTIAQQASGNRVVVQLPTSGVQRTWRSDTDLYTYISERGFHFPREIVTRYLLALRSKPLVLFSGISGTGKTKLALLAAEYYARVPGTNAARWERPQDNDHEFHIPIDRVTLRSGTLTPGREQFDYFNLHPGSTEPFSVTITNVLGAHGDMTFRASSHIYGGRRHLTIQVPAAVRRAFEETGVTDRDYLKFEIVEEFKRFRVSLYRPQTEHVEIPPEDRYAFVSVRPSWRDHTALLGHYDAEMERYVRTPVLELLLRAAREEADAAREDRPPAPYFIILDEMNIAQIEHYFSDFLSALESRRWDQDGSVRQEPLHLHGADAERIVWTDHLGIEYEVPERLTIPTNVLFTGTVNLDDTTHALSPKVVDRASTIVFSAVDFAGYLAGEDAAQEHDPLELRASATRELRLGELELPSAADSREVAETLAPFIDLNGLLVGSDQHFGYRVLNDVAAYIKGARDLVGDTPEVLHAAVDSAVLQKVLPKFYAWSEDRGGLLAELLAYCMDGQMPLEDAPAIDVDALLAGIDIDIADRAMVAGTGDPAFLPRSAGRLARMLAAWD